MSSAYGKTTVLRTLITAEPGVAVGTGRSTSSRGLEKEDSQRARFVSGVVGESILGDFDHEK